MVLAANAPEQCSRNNNCGDMNPNQITLPPMANRPVSVVAAKLPSVRMPEEYAKLVRWVVQHPDWVTMDPVAAARTFIEVEIASQSHEAVPTVGAPITIVAIHRDGSAKWIEPGACKE